MNAQTFYQRKAFPVSNRFWVIFCRVEDDGDGDDDSTTLKVNIDISREGTFTKQGLHVLFSMKVATSSVARLDDFLASG